MHADLPLTRARTGLVLLAGLFLLVACSKQQGGAPGGAAGAQRVGVFTVAAQRLPITTELAGRTVAYQIAEVRPQVGGILKERLFREGAEVKAGEPLYQIDAATFQASFDSAQAALARAEANVASTTARAKRYEELVAIKAVSQQDRDDALATSKQAEADVAVAKANLATARINLAYARISAPIAGRIGKSSVTPGALLTANQATALTTIQQLDPIYVDVTQSASDLMRLRRELGDGRLKNTGSASVKLLLEDGSTYAHQGRMTFSDVTVDQGTGSVTLRAVFPNPDRQLLPGLYVRAVVEEGVRDQAIVVPQQGVTRDPKGNATAMVLNAEDKVEQRTLKIQRAQGNQWVVNEGLQPGDRLIVDGLQKVRPGASATAVPAEQASAPAAGVANSSAAK
ncbi:efflux RND transporter periplasmic adaptor subunit [Uliginosibacterium sp. H3]|uniref:Efflux RND transporter periplasmic adaptor subunit n=1 Tax=Uliginosibacterium silvisoli TaxID=3114758 RepID=A0ABU6K4Q0_9RHOO|nr:efflux RND transporter periplasmic adaptor subunit [Uliginosibacterium sp. H3]